MVVGQPYASPTNVRDITGLESEENVSTVQVVYECTFGDNMVEKLCFREDIDHDSKDFALFQKAAELFAASNILRRFGKDRWDEADANWKEATDICNSIVASSEADDTGEIGITIGQPYTTYPLNPDGEYHALTGKRTGGGTGGGGEDPHHPSI